MYSVMIVDDEKAIRTNLPHAMDFRKYGFQVSAVAKNGKDALEQLEKTPADLIFLDVCMPILDGIGMLRELAGWEENSRPFVVILSGYSDFEYARAAINYGVKGYLLKPVDEDEAEQLLAKMKEELDVRTQRRAKAGIGERVSLLRELHHSGDGSREGFCDDVVVHLMALSHDPEGGLAALRRTMEELIPGGAEAFLHSRGSVATYLLSVPALEEAQHSVTLFGRHAVHLAGQQGGECALLIDDEIFTKPEGAFRRDFEDHFYRMASEIFWGAEGLLLASSAPRYLTERSERRIEEEDALLRKIQNAIREADGEELRAAFEELTLSVEERRLHLVLLQEVCYRIYYALAVVFSEEGLDGAQLQPLDLRSAPAFPRYAKWKELLWNQLSGALDLVTEERKRQKPGLADQAAAYVRAHFREPITLKSAADACFVSPAYLGRCFQKSMAVSLKQYLNDLRLEEAKRLLVQTDLRIYEIAEAAGFGESKHFVSKFTAANGCTPAEFRRVETGHEEKGS